MGRAREVAESWLPCPGGRDLYEVSSTGRVRSWNNNRWGRRRAPIVLAQRANADGYKLVSLGRGTQRYVNRLVCEAFHGTPFEGAEAAHGDGDPGYNAASNLRWATPRQNCADKAQHGTLRQGSTHPAARLSDDQVRDIRRRRAAGERGVDVAAAFGVSPQAVSGITSGSKWRSVA